jgi:hypothetical protein
MTDLNYCTAYARILVSIFSTLRGAAEFHAVTPIPNIALAPGAIGFTSYDAASGRSQRNLTYDETAAR